MENTNVRPTPEVIVMMLTDMIEMGEINYWANVTKVLRGTDEYRMAISMTLSTIDDPKKEYKVNIANLTQAIEKIIEGKVEVRSDIRNAMTDAEWDYDSESGDVVIQVACFGEIVYG